MAEEEGGGEAPPAPLPPYPYHGGGFDGFGGGMGGYGMMPPMMMMGGGGFGMGHNPFLHPPDPLPGSGMGPAYDPHFMHQVGRCCCSSAQSGRTAKSSSGLISLVSLVIAAGEHFWTVEVAATTVLNRARHQSMMGQGQMPMMVSGFRSTCNAQTSASNRKEARLAELLSPFRIFTRSIPA